MCWYPERVTQAQDKHGPDLDLSFCIWFFFDQEWRRRGSYGEGGERHQGEEDSQLSEEQGDWLFQ